MVYYMLMMGATYDFLFGEVVGDTQRYRARHRRDGLCQDCKRQAVKGGRCASHHQKNIEQCRKYYEAMKQKNR